MHRQGMSIQNKKHTYNSILLFMSQIPVLLAATDSYTIPLAVCLYSIIKHVSTDNEYKFHVITNDMSKEHQAVLKTLEKPNHISIEFQATSQELKDTASKINCGRFSDMTLARLEAGKLFPQYDRMVYLDVDTVIQGDIAEIYNTPLTLNKGDANTKDTAMAMALSQGATCLKNNIHHQRILNNQETIPVSAPTDYRNAGVLLMNLAQMREHKLGEAFIQKLCTNTLPYLDQDAINLVLQGSIALLPSTWNFLFCRLIYDMPELLTEPYSSEGVKELAELYKNRSWKLLHMIGPNPPWEPDMHHWTVYYVESWWPVAFECPIFRDEIRELFNEVLTTQQEKLQQLYRKRRFSLFKVRRKRNRQINELLPLVSTLTSIKEKYLAN